MPAMRKKTIGILTGGGDCPGLNAVIRGVTRAAAHDHGMEVIGFEDGFLGMIERRYRPLDPQSVSGLLTQGGTILGSSNRADPFHLFLKTAGGGEYRDVSDRCMQLYDELKLSALVCVGGDGTLTIAGRLAQQGAKVVGVPKTIDNDLMETDATFGFDSALVTATEAVDKLHTTAHAHHRIMLVEVMGRNAGWLALQAGLAGGGDIILIPELPYMVEEMAAAIEERSRIGKRFSIIVVSEGARPAGGEQVCREASGAEGGTARRLGGISALVAADLQKLTGIDTRTTVLGHLQRGGTPTPRDRLLATQFAVKAVELVAAGNFNTMAALRGTAVEAVPIELVMGKQRTVPLDSQLIRAAQSVGTSFGCQRPPCA